MNRDGCGMNLRRKGAEITLDERGISPCIYWIRKSYRNYAENSRTSMCWGGFRESPLIMCIFPP